MVHYIGKKSLGINSKFNTFSHFNMTQQYFCRFFFFFNTLLYFSKLTRHFLLLKIPSVDKKYIRWPSFQKYFQMFKRCKIDLSNKKRNNHSEVFFKVFLSVWNRRKMQVFASQAFIPVILVGVVLTLLSFLFNVLLFNSVLQGTLYCHSYTNLMHAVLVLQIHNNK